MGKILRLMRSSFEREPLLWAIVGLGVVLRLASINYGLPLTLVADEPPFALAALKMLELQTLLPGMHLAEFGSILYYPPYLSYLYLPIFILITAAKYLILGGVFFVERLVSDLSAFFVAARLINLAFAAASIYLTYRVGQFLFHSRVAALAASFLLATSLLHEGLSVVARQWMPISFIFLLALYLLTNERISERRRYLLVLLTAGVGMGFSSVCLFVPLLAGLYWLICGMQPIRALLADKILWLGVAGFTLLAALPSVIYPLSQGFVGGLTVEDSKSVLGFVESLGKATLITTYSEPVLMLLFGVGLCGLLLVRRTRLFLFFVAWICLYIGVFYLALRLGARFMLPLIPLYALVGGWGVAYLVKHRVGVVAVCVLLAVPLISSTYLAYLGLQSDTRSVARTWVLETLSGEKVLVYSDLMRVPTTAAAVEELRTIDSAAIRRADEADAALNVSSYPHALNLYAVSNPAFFAEIKDYTVTHGYSYLVYEPSYGEPSFATAIEVLAEGAEPVKHWNGLGYRMSIATSQFLDPLPGLFSGALLGPTILVYKIN